MAQPTKERSGKKYKEASSKRFYSSFQVSIWFLGLVKKKDGFLRHRDFGAWNKVTIKDEYPLPCIDEFIGSYEL